MDVKVCKNCKKLFNYVYGPEVCPACSLIMSHTEFDAGVVITINHKLNELEVKYNEVRNYVLKHPTASIMQIATDTVIPVTQILDWVREERLEFSEASKYAWFNCDSCGTKISNGRYCSRCKSSYR